MSMNRVVLVGRLTKDPELRITPSGVPVASFTLAVSRPFSNQQGEREADFINCVVWRKPAENVANYLKKGSLAGVDGRVQTRTYDGQDGKRVYVTEVLAESVQFLESRNSGGQDYPNDGQGGGNSQQNNRSQNQNQGNRNNNNNQRSNNQSEQRQNYNTRVDQDPFANSGGQIDISDDDLPF